MLWIRQRFFLAGRAPHSNILWNFGRSRSELHQCWPLSLPFLTKADYSWITSPCQSINLSKTVFASKYGRTNSKFKEVRAGSLLFFFPLLHTCPSKSLLHSLEKKTWPDLWWSPLQADCWMCNGFTHQSGAGGWKCTVIPRPASHADVVRLVTRDKPIFLPILGWKYSCNILNYSLWQFRLRMYWLVLPFRGKDNFMQLSKNMWEARWPHG